MSLPSSANPMMPQEKQKTNVYTVMMILSFLALVTGTVVLSMELNRYGEYPWWRASAATSGAPAAAPAAPVAPAAAPAAPVAPAAAAPAGAAPAAPAAAPAGALPAGGAAAPAPAGS